jgi:hypothetical protein
VIQVDVTEVDEKQCKAETQLPIDVLTLQNADEAMQGDIEDSKEGMDAIYVIDHIPKTKKADSSVDKLAVPDLSRMNFTASLQDVEGDFNLEDKLEYALNLVECEHTTTISLERIDEATFTNGVVVIRERRHDTARTKPRQPFSENWRPDKAVARGTFYECLRRPPVGQRRERHFAPSLVGGRIGDGVE